MKKVIAMSKEVTVSIPDEKLEVYLERFRALKLLYPSENIESLFDYIASAYANGKRGGILIPDIEIYETEFSLF